MVQKLKRVLTAVVVVGLVFGVVGLGVGFVTSSAANFAMFLAAGIGAGFVAGSLAEIERGRRLK